MVESSYCGQAVTFFFFGLQLTAGPGLLTLLWPAPPPLNEMISLLFHIIF